MAIEISEKAAVRIRTLSTEKGTPQGGLRLGVKGGGCSGLSYFIDWATEPAKFDQVIERDGARVFVDPKSAVFLAGDDDRLAADAHADRVRVPEPEREERLRLRGIVHRLTASVVPVRARAATAGERAGPAPPGDRVTCWSCKADVAEGTVFCPSCRKIQPVGRNEDYFSLLGLAREFALDLPGLERRFRELSRQLHPDRFARAEPRERRLSLERATRLNDAYRALRDWRLRAASPTS